MRQAESQTPNLFERMPPQSLQAERCVLGSMLLDGNVIGDVLRITRRDHFVRDSHQALFAALADMFQSGTAIDLVTVRDELDRRKLFESVGGEQTLVELVNAVPAPDHAEHYAKIVRGKYLLRSVVSTATNLLRDAMGETDDPAAMTYRAIEALSKVASDEIGGDETPSVADLAAEAVKAILTKPEGILPTGLTDVDRILGGGLEPGTLTIIAGRPAMGKTAAAGTIADNLAMAGYNVGFFTAEMRDSRIATRSIASRARVNARVGREGTPTDDETNRVNLVAADPVNSRLLVRNASGMTIARLHGIARYLVRRRGVVALLVDYLQILAAERQAGRSREQEVSAISAGLLTVCHDLNVPVVAMAQLNRAVDARSSHRPTLSDLRESGSIEQVADTVILLHREEYYHQKTANDADDTPPKCPRCDGAMQHRHGAKGAFWGCLRYPECKGTAPAKGEAGLRPEDIGTAEWIIAKQRSGMTGSVRVRWTPELTLFSNLNEAKPDEF